MLGVGHLAGRARRFEEMAEIMESYAVENAGRAEMCLDERNMLSLAFSSLVNSKRKAIQIVKENEAFELSSGNEKHVEWCRKRRIKVSNWSDHFFFCEGEV